MRISKKERDSWRNYELPTLRSIKKIEDFKFAFEELFEELDEEATLAACIHAMQERFRHFDIRCDFTDLLGNVDQDQGTLDHVPGRFQEHWLTENCTADVLKPVEHLDKLITDTSATVIDLGSSGMPR